MIPPEKLIITADDFGMSLGVNDAVLKAHLQGGLTNASVMVNAKYAQDAVNLAQAAAPDLKLGLHVNLTGGKPVLPSAEVPNLVNASGNFKYGTVGLLLQTIFKPKIIAEIAREIEAQILKLQAMNVPISHLDGHHHVQMIPALFKIVQKLAAKYNIQRVRVVNENIFNTICQTRNFMFFLGSGFARFAIIKSLYYFNNYKTRTYFFSILNSCAITPQMLRDLKIPKGFDSIEIMLHPGNPELDKNADTGEIYELPHLTSNFRNQELAAALLFKRVEE